MTISWSTGHFPTPSVLASGMTCRPGAMSRYLGPPELGDAMRMDASTPSSAASWSADASGPRYATTTRAPAITVDIDDVQGHRRTGAEGATHAGAHVRAGARPEPDHAVLAGREVPVGGDGQFDVLGRVASQRHVGRTGRDHPLLGQQRGRELVDRGPRVHQGRVVTGIGEDVRDDPRVEPHLAFPARCRVHGHAIAGDTPIERHPSRRDAEGEPGRGDVQPGVDVVAPLVKGATRRQQDRRGGGRG